MNCQECRDLFDDMLDRRIKEPLKRRMLNHLTNCTECSDRLERRRKAHAALFRALNHFNGVEHLSDGFADRLVAECRCPQSWWQSVTVPKWALLAASLALMVGFAFAATVVVDAVTAKDDDSEGIEGTQATEVTDGSGALAASAAISDVPYVPNIASIPSDENPPSTDNQLQGENAMTKRKAAAAALTAAIAAAPLAAANGDEYQFIISGDPVAAETVDTSESASIGTALVTSTRTSPTAAASLEARYRTFDESVGIKLRTDSPKGMIISVK